ncbi:hypothetical protein ACNFU2_06415 [Chryseobacterium sp. PTM-20240506]|uniref:hypothetical protein n=1 Tax=Chryseobacterium sp. PTM-20240506 TaxID=3400631 RepID=UPI003AB0BBF3
MKENSYIETKDYFENLVEQSNFINEFVAFSEREWAAKKAQVGGIKAPVLALFRYELGFEGNDHNTIAVRKLGFAIMFNKIPAGDFQAQYNAIYEAEKLAIKMLSRIMIDSCNPNHFLYNSFMKETVEIKPVELSSSDFGVDVLFSLKNKQILKVDTNDWKDLDQICR